MQDFKECLEDLEQQVADFTDEVQQLAQYTSESISFEVCCELLYPMHSAEQHTLNALLVGATNRLSVVDWLVQAVQKHVVCLCCRCCNRS